MMVYSICGGIIQKQRRPRDRRRWVPEGALADTLQLRVERRCRNLLAKGAATAEKNSARRGAAAQHLLVGGRSRAMGGEQQLHLPRYKVAPASV
jgi:hypothetical protein